MGKEPFQHCREVVRQNDFGRYLASLYLPPVARNAAFAIYAFHMEINQIAARISEPLPGEIRLQWWRDVLGGENPGEGNPVAEALLETITRHCLPRARFEQLLDAHIFDFYHDPMPDRTSLEAYLGETRSTLFHLLTMVVLNKNEQRNYGMAISDACGHGGVFVGCVELLGHLGMHHHQQRQYFPEDLSDAAGPALRGLVTTHVDDKWLRDIISFAHTHRNSAAGAISQLPKLVQTLFLPIVAIDLRFEKIKRLGVDLRAPDIPPSRLKIWWRLFQAVRTGEI